MNAKAMSERGCCFDNHRADLVAVYGPYEIWMNARTGQAEVFVRAEAMDQEEAMGIPPEVETMLAQYSSPAEDRRGRWKRVLGTVILVTWLILACTTTTLLAALMVLRLS